MLNITIARLRNIATALWLASPSRWRWFRRDAK